MTFESVRLYLTPRRADKNIGSTRISRTPSENNTAMNESLRQLLDSVTDAPPRSKLEPYTDVIRELRRKRQTYRQISRFFAEHLSIAVAPSTIHAFVKVRARRRGRLSYEIFEPAEDFLRHSSASASPPANKTNGGDDPIEALRQRKPPAARERRFTFNDEDDLPLISTKEKPDR